MSCCWVREPWSWETQAGGLSGRHGNHTARQGTRCRLGAGPRWLAHAAACACCFHVRGGVRGEQRMCNLVCCVQPPVCNSACMRVGSLLRSACGNGSGVQGQQRCSSARGVGTVRRLCRGRLRSCLSGEEAADPFWAKPNVRGVSVGRRFGTVCFSWFSKSRLYCWYTLWFFSTPGARGRNAALLSLCTVHCGTTSGGAAAPISHWKCMTATKFRSATAWL